jgi:phosphoglycolate phosphatase-like HAD superfamily hydrolase
MSLPTLPRPSLIIFDVDGTLIDIRESYRAALPVAVTRYLSLLGLNPPRGLTADAHDLFKPMGGFNDDWDLMAGCLQLLLAGDPPGSLPPALPLPTGAAASQVDLLAALPLMAAPIVQATGGTLPMVDIAAAIEPVRRAGGGLAGVRALTGGYNAHLVCHAGRADTTDLVQRVFEEIYLGERPFAAAYGMPAAFQRGPGLIERERLLIDRGTLDVLSRFARLGIATGRAIFELAPALEVFGLGHYFGSLATMSDALAAAGPGESLLKPHPFLLRRAADALDPTGQLVAAYVGDAPDDVVAARRASPRPWQVIALTTSGDRDTLRQQFIALGADVVLDHPDELVQLWR